VNKNNKNLGTLAEPRTEAKAQDVAEAAGVSRIMVSRAFNPAASIRPDKRDMILKVAGQLGYHPDMAARSMATGRSNLIAILVPSLARAWESQEVDALVQSLQAEGLATLVFRLTPEGISSPALRQVRAYKPAAVIAFMDLIAPQDLLPIFGNSPAIYPHYGEAAPLPTPGAPIDRLHINQHAGIRSGVRLLASAGHRRIAYVSGASPKSARPAFNANSDADRFAALRNALESFGLEFAGEIGGEFDYQTARQGVVNFVRNGGRADAYFAANDISAFGALDALRFDLDLPVPERCAVIGFDNVSEAGWRAYDLTTVGIPIQTRVAALMRLILARIEEPAGPPRVETVTATLTVRSSV
jgi:DNA-binding LacI/PurR family transcriptional regulator